MSNIQIVDLTYRYDGAEEDIFKNVSLNLDTNWKLGLIGRNGKGKTTLLKLLLNKYEYIGKILSNIQFEYFPFDVKNKNRLTIDIIEDIVLDFEEWKIIKELNLLNTDINILYKPFNTLSGGEQVKVLLATLFIKDNSFLLIDEPTNHLDNESRKNIEQYLKNKRGFILVSHDRELIDNTVDHILSINNNNIELIKGNYTTWKENKDRQDMFEIKENDKLKQQIGRLETATKNTASWSDKIEKSKFGDGHVDKGYIGHQAAKMMKRSKAIIKRQEKAIEDKSKLLKNIDRSDLLTIKPLKYKKDNLIIADKLEVKYGKKIICNNVCFSVNVGDRLAIIGSNGSGKSSILKLLIDENIEYNGILKKGTDIKISYIPQNTDCLFGTISEISKQYKIDESIFKAMLSKLGLNQLEFNKDISNLSEGQKKKVLVAKSITESADLYIWDEPLNYVDILSRIQIEESILKYKPTMIFVEHDKTFIKNISTKILEL